MPIKQSFSDHVNELRLRLLVWFIFFIAGSVIGFLKSGFFLSLMVKPLGEPLFYTSPMGGFNFIMQIAILFGFLVSLPILIYEIIKFCQPVLSTNVKKVVPKLVIFSFCLLILSLFIAFYIFIPAAIHFLKGFGGSQIQALITTNEYFSFILIYLIGLAILFQMPVIILLINYITRLTTKQLMKWQKIMIVLSFVVAAILTPTPDPINQTIMAAPIIVLYEISILLVWMVNRGQKSVQEEVVVPGLKSWKKRTLNCFTFFLIVVIMTILAIFLVTNYIQYRQNKKISSREDMVIQKPTKAKDTSVIPINQDSFTNVSSDTSKFVVAGQNIISARINSNDLFLQTLNGKDEAKVIYSFSKGSEVSNLYLDETNDRILVATSNKQIFNVSLTDGSSVVEVDPPNGESWPKINSLTSYLFNIYVLDDTGTIWKYTSSDGKIYQTKSSYLTDSNATSKDVKAITADGSIYLLKNDGKVSKFSRGVTDKFSSPELPANSTWQSPGTIFTDTTSDNIYIQDNDKIVEITKLGQYQRQFVLLDKQIKSSFISAANKMGWVLSGDKIFQFDLN